MFVREENRGGHRQKVYVDTFTIQVGEAVNQLVGHVHMFLHIWKPGELELPSEFIKSDLKKNRKQKAVFQPNGATQVVCVPSVIHVFSSVERE